jgi:20S proteasome subunit alpha 7
MADRISQYVSAYTLYSSVRPFGISALIATMDKGGPGLYMVEPSGVCYGYMGAAIGKGRTLARTELEKLKFSELTCREAVKEAARMYVSWIKFLTS